MLVPNPEYINELIETVKKSPFPSHMCMQLTGIKIDASEVELDAGKNHLQPFGIIHGGVIATLIDTATFWAAFLRIPENAGMVNIDLKLNYLKSVNTGILTARGQTIRSGRSISYAEASVFDAQGELLAHGTSTLMTLPDKGLSLSVPKFIE
ncbi:Phenylacetic acid degradation thioesterase [Desulfonema limicola]|uniref:Phenylacetic acid degradation thioesterase n=1 Tax=Desulfonema limicola TaxID=45656 RepID=A0A975B554_9BACT|nr:PaaI family thioesterase [Desulfonema limicola]QTA78991.1 Phenylacetic acid degradation thioesterase [Desulfonema limicola]